eukprot:gene4890-34656_t
MGYKVAPGDTSDAIRPQLSDPPSVIRPHRSALTRPRRLNHATRQYVCRRGGHLHHPTARHRLLCQIDDSNLRFERASNLTAGIPWERAGKLDIVSSQAPAASKRQHMAKDELLLQQMFCAANISTPQKSVTNTRFKRDKSASEIRDLVDSWTASSSHNSKAAVAGPAQDRKPAKDTAALSGTTPQDEQKNILRKDAQTASTTVRHMRQQHMLETKPATANSSQAAEPHTTLHKVDSSRTPLKEMFTLYDIVCNGISEEEEVAAEEAARARAARAKEERAEQHRREQKMAAEQGTLMVNFMPMVREFLTEEISALTSQHKGSTPQAPPRTFKRPGQKSAPVAAVQAMQAQPLSEAELPGSCPEASAEQSDDEDFVYDVYVPVDDLDAGGTEQDTIMKDWDIPVVEVEEEYDDGGFWDLDPDLLAALAAVDHDSEDSNAESFYANSYPDDDNNFGVGYSDSDEDDDEDAGWRRGRWQDEEYDLTQQDSDGEEPGSLADLEKKAQKEASLMQRGPVSRMPPPPKSSQLAGEWGHRLR